MKRPLTLRQHVAKALEILDIAGVSTLVPSMLPPTQRRDGADNQRDYALSILLPLKKHDRTGWVLIYESASREAAGRIWDSLPAHHVCPACLVLLQPTRQGLRPLPCAGCGARRQAIMFKNVVTVDIRRVSAALRQGGIVVG